MAVVPVFLLIYIIIYCIKNVVEEQGTVMIFCYTNIWR